MTANAERCTGKLFRDAFDLEEHFAWLDDRNPLFDGSLTLTHSSLEGLFRKWLVWEDSDVELALTFDLTLDGHSTRFDLAGRKTTTGGSLESVVSERNVRAAVRFAAHTASELLTEFGSFWLKHEYSAFQKARGRHRRGRGPP